MTPVMPSPAHAELPPENQVRCCASCGSAALVKSGHNSCGTQQYLCKNCGAHRVLRAKSRATHPGVKAQVLHAVVNEHISLREAERRFGVARQTIARWRKRDGVAAPLPSGPSRAPGVGAYPREGFR